MVVKIDSENNSQFEREKIFQAPYPEAALNLTSDGPTHVRHAPILWLVPLQQRMASLGQEK
jgi:hypothetical protein